MIVHASIGWWDTFDFCQYFKLLIRGNHFSHITAWIRKQKLDWKTEFHTTIKIIFTFEQRWKNTSFNFFDEQHCSLWLSLPPPFCVRLHVPNFHHQNQIKSNHLFLLVPLFIAMRKRFSIHQFEWSHFWVVNWWWLWMLCNCDLAAGSHESLARYNAVKEATMYVCFSIADKKCSVCSAIGIWCGHQSNWKMVCSRCLCVCCVCASVSNWWCQENGPIRKLELLRLTPVYY